MVNSGVDGYTKTPN